MPRTYEEVFEFQSARDPMITTQTEYYVSDGTELAIDVYRPNPQKYPGVRPGILFFFGGGFYVGTRWAFREQGEACAKQGYVALTADYRVGSLHKTTPKESIRDGARAWEFVREHAARWSLDPEKIVLAGGSAGGIISIMCGLLTGCRPAGLALFCPGLLDENMGPERLAAVIGSEVDGIPLPNAGSIPEDLPPILLMHGEKDAIVPISTIQKFAEKAKTLGTDVRLVVYTEAEHGFMNYNRNRAYFYLTLGELLMFLEKINKK